MDETDRKQNRQIGGIKAQLKAMHRDISRLNFALKMITLFVVVYLLVIVVGRL